MSVTARPSFGSWQMDDCDDVSNYDDDDDYMFYENDGDDECDYLSMQTQFDNADLPADAEVTVSWLNQPASSSKVSSQVSSSSHLAGAQTSTPTNPEHASSGFLLVPASNSTLVSGGSNSRGKKEASEDEETNDNWHWFLSELKSAVCGSRPIFIFDFQRGIRESSQNVFGEECYHGFCLCYLVEKLNNDLKGQFSNEARRLMIQDLYAAACAPKRESFDRYVENIKAISPEVYNWVNELPITQMIDVLCGKIMELIYIRRVESIKWVTTLTPLMEQKLQSETSRVRPLHLLSSYGSRYEVLYMVDAIDEYTVGQLKEYDRKKLDSATKEDQLTDIFTKALPKETLHEQLGVTSKQLKEEC
ncbi:hypothetical protein BC332_29525 [Capsicum chinense]|nr:hypothetical protein BC332_29525 [Capsicum chinense]